MYIHVYGNLQIICIFNFTVTQVSITNLPHWGTHETISQEWLRNHLVLSSSWIHHLLYLHLPVCFSVSRLKASLSRILFSQLITAWCLVLLLLALCLTCIELWSCCSLIFLLLIGVAQTQGRNCWSVTPACIGFYSSGRSFGLGERTAKVLRREQQNFGARQRCQNHIMSSAHVHGYMHTQTHTQYTLFCWCHCASLLTNNLKLPPYLIWLAQITRTLRNTSSGDNC